MNLFSKINLWKKITLLRGFVFFIMIWVFYQVQLPLHHQQRTIQSLTKNSKQKIRVVNLAIMPNYISEDSLHEFKNKTGIQVQLANYTSNEELLAKIQTGASSYDVALPSDYMIFILNQLGLLEEINHHLIPNLKQIPKYYLNKNYDSHSKYSIPYNQGTTGIAVNRTLFQGNISSWHDLLTDPLLSEKFSLLDDVREVIGIALKSLGYSFNSRNPEELNQAKQLLLSVRHRVKAFTSEPIFPLVQHEVEIAQVYMSDALHAKKKSNENIEFIFPKEGGSLWLDSLIIPKGALNKKEAHELINFLLEPKINAYTVMNFFMAPLNIKTLDFLPLELKQNPVLFPNDSILSKYEMIEDLGDASTIWDHIWTEIKTY